jgi:hypothetical protein
VRAERERGEARGVAGRGSPFIGWRGKGRRRSEAVGKRFRRWAPLKLVELRWGGRSGKGRDEAARGECAPAV